MPKSLRSLEEADFHRTLAPKVGGLQNVLRVVDPARLRLLVAFSSIIARTGMPGEADYAVANDWLTDLTTQFQQTHPHCLCLALEWSVWSGVGMGERLGRIEGLKRQGITPISPDDGVQMLKQLLSRSLPTVATVVAGRIGDQPTLNVDSSELPLLRFLEQPRVFVPGVELVSESKLSQENDPYLSDHVYQNMPLLPAVMGVEAMAQVVMALNGNSNWSALEFRNVTFQRPIVVPVGSQETIRVAALRRAPDCIETVIRAEETGFQTDHFGATCRVHCEDTEIDSQSHILSGFLGTFDQIYLLPSGVRWGFQCN